MFNDHKRVVENGKTVLHLFTQPFDANATLVEGIFEHLHEDVLLDWVHDYLDNYDVLFRGNLIKIFWNDVALRELRCSIYTQNLTTVAEGKVIEFRVRAG